MSIIDKALEANQKYAKSYDPKLGGRPAPKIVVVTCMDPRLSDLPGILVCRRPISTSSEPADPQSPKMFSAELVVSTRVSGQQRSCCSTTPAAGSRPSPMKS